MCENKKLGMIPHVWVETRTQKGIWTDESGAQKNTLKRTSGFREVTTYGCHLTGLI